MIEHEIFSKSKCDFSKLEPFGFVKNYDGYFYSRLIINNDFRVEVQISNSGEVKGKVIELAFDDEYTNYRVENAGGFANNILTAFEEVLLNIRDKCFVKLYYENERANEFINYIIENYGDYPIFEWKRQPTISTIRNHKNNEWYAFFLDNQIYIKLPENRVKQLLKKEGICKSYFMNERQWIIIPYNSRISNEEIISYIDEAHYQVDKQSHWLVPANPKYYDVVSEFDKSDIVIWKQKGKIYVGDIIYLYLASPISSILYKCKVIETNIPFEYKDKNLNIDKVFKMKLIKKYEQGELSINLLKQYGITWIRGQRRLPDKLIKEINKKEENNVN